MASADNMAQTQGEGLRLDKVLTNMNETAGNHLFDPAKHLNFKPPTRVLTMRDVGLPEDHGVSPFAVSEPFSLFTAEAVQEMRKEIFQPQVLKNYSYTSNIAQCQLRGYEKKEAPFIYSCWKNPVVLEKICQVAGIELVPAVDYELAHINLSTKTEAQKATELAALPDKALAKQGERDDADAIVGWHTDSYPFVCVTMLSDCTNMIGGETALRTGDGKIMKVRGPQMGCAVVLQGRYIAHQALRAFGNTERITSVTSLRPKDYAVKDDTVLKTVRPVSDLSELYGQFTEYRLDILENRIKEKLDKLREEMRSDKRFDTNSMKKFLQEQEEFLSHMIKEMVDDELVIPGEVPVKK